MISVQQLLLRHSSKNLVNLLVSGKIEPSWSDLFLLMGSVLLILFGQQGTRDPCWGSGQHVREHSILQRPTTIITTAWSLISLCFLYVFTVTQCWVQGPARTWITVSVTQILLHSFHSSHTLNKRSLNPAPVNPRSLCRRCVSRRCVNPRGQQGPPGARGLLSLSDLIPPGPA